MPTLAQLVDSYTQHLTLAARSERTLGGYRAYLQDFLGFLERRGLGAGASAGRLTRELVTEYQLDLAQRRGRGGKPVSAATRNVYAAAVRGLLRHGITVLALDLPAPDTVVVAKVGDRVLRRMDREDFERLVEAIAPTGRNALRDRALIEVLFSTGCRLSELCSLTRRRVDLRNREVEVFGKGRKVRGTYLTPEAADWLERYLDSRGDDATPLFVSTQAVRVVRDPRTGERRRKKSVYPLAPRTVEGIVTKLARRAGLPDDFSPHWFRHGRLTVVARHAGLLAAQELAGHASPQTTRRYTRVTSAELKKHFDESERREREG